MPVPPIPTEMTARAAIGTSEDSRSFLQDRVQLLAKVLFTLATVFLVLPFLALLAFMGLDAAVETTFTALRLPHVLLVLALGSIWAVLRRARMTTRALHVVDAGILAISLVSLVSLVARMSTGNSGGLTIALALGHFLVLRAVIVPSSGRRTFWLSFATNVAAVVVFGVWGSVSPHQSEFDNPVAPFHANLNLALWLFFAVASSTIASRVIFGLREEVRKARTIGQYVIQRQLGEGGMGVVFQATHAMLRRETAIKLLHPNKVDGSTLARFEREVRQTARLTHPNTVAIFDYGRTPDGVFYYAMEYLDGIDLQRLVESDGALPPSRVVHLLAQVLASLAEAHETGLIHRDIKPANLMLTQRGGESDVIKVLDFGLVKEVKGDDTTNLTAAHSITGTPMYLPPEAIASPEKVSEASDLYAVAAVGYFLLTGSEVFQGTTVIEICAHHLHSNPEHPAARAGKQLPGDLTELLLRGLEKNPDARPPNAREFRRALLACDVPAWTDEEARAWWTQRGAVIRERREQASQSSPDTLLIDLGRRS
jgi:eukaryotic-like serine/threonine-protein kinase